MSKKNVTVGEFALIPVDNNAFVPAKVLYLSKRFKDTILLAVYPTVTTTPEIPDTLPESSIAEFYTTQKAITSGRWLSVGVQELRPNEVGRAKRVVAGEVWQDDNHLGPASDADLATLPKMLAMGAKLVEKHAQKVADSQAS